MDVRDLIKLMKQERCLKIKMGQLEVELSPMAFAPDEAPKAGTTAPAIPENFTFWSVADQSPLPVIEAVQPEGTP